MATCRLGGVGLYAVRLRATHRLSFSPLRLIVKHFTTIELREAFAYAAAGQQALHTHSIIVDAKRAPQCFVQAVRRGERIAHLFDQDKERLVATARRLGVRVIYIDREDTSHQHIDLCGAPLRRALQECAYDNIGEVPCDSSSTTSS